MNFTSRVSQVEIIKLKENGLSKSPKQKKVASLGSSPKWPLRKENHNDNGKDNLEIDQQDDKTDQTD